MKADLHLHSKFSDGAQWPEEIVSLAKKKHFEIIALTDHDTMAGINRFMALCKKNNIIGIPAVEIDFDKNSANFKSEVLGYFPNGKYTNTLAVLGKIHEKRQKLAKLAIQEKCFQGISNYKPSLFSLIEVINSDGGFAVMAHLALNYENDFNDLFKNKPSCLKLFSNLKDAGLWGIELHAYSYDLIESDSLNEFFKVIASRTGLQLTYGSDSHGQGNYKDNFGRFFGNFSGFSPNLAK